MIETDVVVLGDCNADLVVNGGEVEPAFGQAERIVDEAKLTIGGSGAIFAVGAARLGLRTALVGVVGDDTFGHFMLRALRAQGVDVSGCVVDPEVPTGLTIHLCRPGDRAMLTQPGTIAGLRPDMVDRELLRSTRHVHVSSYFLQTGLWDGLSGLLDECRSAGATTSADPNWDPSGTWDQGLHELIPFLTCFLPNGQEAVAMTGTSTVETAVETLASPGVTIAVKLGSDGAVARLGGESYRTPTLAGLEPCDTVGAGDSFDAGFVAGLLSGWGVDRCLALAAACGALSVRGPGGTDAQPTREEALRALEALGRQTAQAGRAGNLT
ncbi:MAG: carbohydrate kinase family protein [Nocardioidaceae bacterium]